MARGTQFQTLIEMLRNELGRSNDPAVGLSDLPSLKQQLNRYYERLHMDYDWPHLMRRLPKVTVNAGQRYYDVPTTTTYDEIVSIHVWQNGQPLPLGYGISIEDYGIFDSQEDVRADPIEKWDITFTGTKEQIEIWPMPASAGSFQPIAKRKWARLVNNDDVCAIDDNLVVLRAAAMLTGDEKDKQLKLAEAADLLATLRANSKSGTGSFKLGGGGVERRPYGPVVVRVS